MPNVGNAAVYKPRDPELDSFPDLLESKRSVGRRLSLMMALAYSIQGAFWPLLAVHLKDLNIPSHYRGLIFSTLAFGSMAMPLGFGQLIDRFLPAQRLLSLISFIAALFLALLSTGSVASPHALTAFFFLYWLITAPTTSLTNTIALRHIPRPSEQFPGVRLWGTVGWMAVGWLVSTVMAVTGSVTPGRGAYESFWIAGGLALLLSLYALTLPNTPPLAKGASSSEKSQLLPVIRAKGMKPFLATAFGVSLTTPFVFQVMPTYLESQGLSRAWISTALTLGQIPEVVMLAILPWLVERIGTKPTLLLGITAWCLRFGSLTLHSPLWLTIAGIQLHGVGFACFTVAGQIQMDRMAPRELRGSCQALYTVVTSGIGSLCGSLLAGFTIGLLASDDPLVFLFPCVIDCALLVYFLTGFRSATANPAPSSASITGRPLIDDAARGPLLYAGNRMTESADG